MRRSDCRERSDATAIICQDVDIETGEVVMLTKQEFRDECDINKILDRYTPEALEERLAAANGVYADFSSIMTYGEAKQLIVDSDNAFMSLPAKIRGRFDNDVTQFIDFMEDSSNDEEAIRLGLKAKPVATQGFDVPPEPSLDVTGGTDTASVS